MIVSGNILDAGSSGLGDIRLYTNNALNSISFTQNKKANGAFPVFDTSLALLTTNSQDSISSQNFSGNGYNLTNLVHTPGITASSGTILVTPTQQSTGESNYDLTTCYSTNLISDFLVTSNWFANGTGATGYTNSPAFLTVPSGTYQETATFYLLPITGSDIMGANLVWNHVVTVNTIQIFGQLNSTATILGGWGDIFAETRGNGGLLSSQMVTFQGTVKVSVNPTTVYLGGSHVFFTTNSFYVKAGSSLTLQRIGN